MKKAKVARPIRGVTVVLRAVNGQAFPATQNLYKRKIHLCEWPETFYGFSWDFQQIQIFSLLTSVGTWAILLVRQGQPDPSGLASADGSVLHAPQDSLLVWGTFTVYDQTEAGYAEAVFASKGSSSTQRKLQPGDAIWFVSEVDSFDLTLNEVKTNGVIQFYLKS